jgi:hypothetical protein
MGEGPSRTKCQQLKFQKYPAIGHRWRATDSDDPYWPKPGFALSAAFGSKRPSRLSLTNVHHRCQKSTARRTPPPAQHQIGMMRIIVGIRIIAIASAPLNLESIHQGAGIGSEHRLLTIPDLAHDRTRSRRSRSVWASSEDAGWPDCERLLGVRGCRSPTAKRPQWLMSRPMA